MQFHVGCLFIVSIVIAFPHWPKRVFAQISKIGMLADRPWLVRIEIWTEEFVNTLALCKSWTFTLQLLVFSIIAWMLEGAVFATVSWSLQTSSAPLGPWFSLSTGTLATLLPSTPGYIGTFDYFTILGLTAYGVNRNVAGIFAIMIHVLLWLPITLVGLVCFARLRGRAIWNWVIASENK
jgi:uncharacterized membrane protein YbhN (UPF0104 family)